MSANLLICRGCRLARCTGRCVCTVDGRPIEEHAEANACPHDLFEPAMELEGATFAQQRAGAVTQICLACPSRSFAGVVGDCVLCVDAPMCCGGEGAGRVSTIRGQCPHGYWLRVTAPLDAAAREA